MIPTIDFKYMGEPNKVRIGSVTCYENEAWQSGSRCTGGRRLPFSFRKNGCKESVRVDLDLVKQGQIVGRRSTNPSVRHVS